jgi:hypothetical protein
MRQAGNDWFSVKDIARETNVSAGIIYHYFGNKEPLLLEVMKNAFYIFHEKPPSINVDISTVVAVSGVSKKYFSTKFLTLFLKYVYILH